MSSDGSRRNETESDVIDLNSVEFLPIRKFVEFDRIREFLTGITSRADPRTYCCA